MGHGPMPPPPKFATAAASVYTATKQLIVFESPIHNHWLLISFESKRRATTVR